MAQAAPPSGPRPTISSISPYSRACSALSTRPVDRSSSTRLRGCPVNSRSRHPPPPARRGRRRPPCPPGEPHRQLLQLPQVLAGGRGDLVGGTGDAVGARL